MAFTGDSLLIRNCGLTATCAAQERRDNPRLGGDIDAADFAGCMNHLGRPHPSMLCWRSDWPRCWPALVRHRTGKLQQSEAEGLGGAGCPACEASACKAHRQITN
jgi:hypothetical protein